MSSGEKTERAEEYNTSRLSRGDLVVYTGKWSRNSSAAGLERYGRYFVVLDVEEKQWPGAIARCYDPEVAHAYYYAGDLEIIAPSEECEFDLPPSPTHCANEDVWPEELVYELVTRWRSWDEE